MRRRASRSCSTSPVCRCTSRHERALAAGAAGQRFVRGASPAAGWHASHPTSPSPFRRHLRPSPSAPSGAGHRFDKAARMEVVTFMERYWRLAANPGFNASLDHIRGRLMAAGRPAADPSTFGSTSIRTEGRGWDYPRGTLTIAGDSRRRCCRGSRTASRSRSIRSRHTPADGRARLVDVGAGTAADYAGKDVKGAVVLGDAPARPCCGARRSAIAVPPASSRRDCASTSGRRIRRYRTSPEGRPAVGQRALRREAKAFGFKATWRAADRLRAAEAGPVDECASTSTSTFYTGPNRTLVAEIAGSRVPTSASSSSRTCRSPAPTTTRAAARTLMALARALNEAIASGAFRRPRARSRSCGSTRSAAAGSGSRRTRTRRRASATCSRST